MITFLITLLIIGGIFFTLFGMFVTYHIARRQKLPADESNRINKIRLIWFVLTRENLFTEVFPWLKNDELKNITKS